MTYLALILTATNNDHQYLKLTPDFESIDYQLTKSTRVILIHVSAFIKEYLLLSYVFAGRYQCFPFLRIMKLVFVHYCTHFSSVSYTHTFIILNYLLQVCQCSKLRLPYSRISHQQHQMMVERKLLLLQAVSAKLAETNGVVSSLSVVKM